MADHIAENTQLICFDEFQVLDITDAMLLGRLFTALIQRDIYFIMTSNRPPKDLYLNGLNRQLFLPFIDTLYKEFQILTLDHEIDFRTQKISHQDHYLFPLNTQTQAKFQKIWHILTDNAQGEQKILENAGRKIIISQTFKHIAKIDFNTLCDQPLGASDYILLADNFPILLLDNMPQLTKEMRNQATRFRNLIDAYYEKKAKIYFRCDVETQDLYPQGDFNFEFERTISRIQEMQSMQYQCATN